MKEFYENLKAKRQEKGISLEDIYERTRIPRHYLQAIEAGEMDKLPRGYERIYLRRYSREIGLDPDEVIHDYDLLTGRLTPSPEETASLSPGENPPPISETSPTRSSPTGNMRRVVERLNLDRIHKVFWITLAVLTISVAGYMTYQQYIFEEKSRKIEVKEISISELIEDLQAQDSLLTPQLSDNTVLRSEQRPQFTVELRALERTWVREIRDQKDTTEYILPVGLKRSIEAVDQVKFVLGRADGVEIWLNGKNLGTMGEADQVVLSLVLNRDGIVDKRLKKVTRPPTTRSDTASASPAPGDSLR